MAYEEGEPRGAEHDGRSRGARGYRARLRAWSRWYRDRLTDRSRAPWQRALYAAGGLVGIGAAVLILLLLYALVLVPFTPTVAELKKAKAARPSVVLSADGEVLTRFEQFNREWVTLDEVSPAVIDALIATEDHRFYGHWGIDLKRMIGAGVSTVTGDLQGGSTLTQQLARNLYPDEIGRSISLTRKMKEIVTAFKIEGSYTKEEILETYLNSVPFLYNVYGIGLAARTYFGKRASELGVLEAATLVGMLKGTSYYNPVRHPERALERRNVVLGQMVKRQKLSQEEFDELREAPLGLAFERPAPEESKAPHFTAFVRNWAAEWADQSGYDLYADGLILHSTLDLALQRAAEEAVVRQGERLQRAADEAWSRSSSPFRLASSGDGGGEAPSELLQAWIRGTEVFEQRRAAGVEEEALLDSLSRERAFLDSLRSAKTRVEVGLVAIDPQSGDVKAWVGSRSFDRSQYDRVSSARRQPGSTFKPFVYARALQEGFSPDDTFRDESVEIPLENGTVWRPTNADDITGEPVTLRDALVHSKNTVTAQLVQEIGPRDVASLARRMGVNRSELDAVPSLALGTSEVTLLEMTSAYATFAREGRYLPPRWVTTIEDSTGAVVETFETEPEEALDADVALRVLDMMRGVVDEGTARGLRHEFGLRGDLAGKTGTTQNGADGWFILVHPELVSGAWVGFDDPRVTFRSDYWGQGAHNALFVVGDFVRRAVRRDALETGVELPRPPEVEEERSLPERVRGWFEDIFGSAEDPPAGEAGTEGGGVDAAAEKGEDGQETREASARRGAREELRRREEEMRSWVRRQEEQIREAVERWEEGGREARGRRGEEGRGGERGRGEGGRGQ